MYCNQIEISLPTYNLLKKESENHIHNFLKFSINQQTPVVLYCIQQLKSPPLLTTLPIFRGLTIPIFMDKENLLKAGEEHIQELRRYLPNLPQR